MKLNEARDLDEIIFAPSKNSNNLTLLAELVLHLLAPIIAIPHDSLLISIQAF